MRFRGPKFPLPSGCMLLRKQLVRASIRECHFFNKSPTALSGNLQALSTPTSHKISARTNQIARHFSGSSSSSHNSPTANINMASEYRVRKIGAPNTLEHRIYIEKGGVPISPFHDIPLYANEQQTVLNMVVEIPRWTNGKLEVCYFRLQLFTCSVLPRITC